MRDPSDEMVLETGVNKRADLLVTFNERDCGTVPKRFGIPPQLSYTWVKAALQVEPGW